MRVAVLLSGNLRNIESHIEKLASIYSDMDIFIHAWKNKYSLRAHGTYGSTDKDKLRQVESIKLENLEHFNYKKIKIQEQVDIASLEEYKSFLNIGSFGANDLKYTAFSQWLGVYEALRLKREYELENDFVYDVVIRSTFDIIPEINIFEPQDNTIYYSNFNDFSYDRLLYSKSNVMDKIYDIVFQMDKIEKKPYTSGLNPEGFLEDYIKSFKGIKKEVTDKLSYVITRT